MASSEIRIIAEAAESLYKLEEGFTQEIQKPIPVTGVKFKEI